MVNALLTLQNPALDNAMTSCTRPMRSFSENTASPLAASLAIAANLSSEYNTRSVVTHEYKRRHSEDGLTNTISSCVELERFRGVNGECLLPSVKNDRFINVGFIVSSCQQGQRHGPDSLVVLFFCRSRLQETILANMDAILALDDSEDGETDLMQDKLE